jgi:Gylcosyl hydrolase family 115 C-terminal domain
MMSQTHIGYSSWNSPPRNTMPPVTEVQLSKAAEMGVAVEGSESPVRGASAPALPILDAFEAKPRYLEIFNRGGAPFEFRIEASEPWITLTKASGTVARGERIFVDARWPEVPEGAHAATLTILGPDARKVVVQVPVRKLPVPARAGFVETGGVVSIEAEHFTRALAPAGRQWLRIPDHGRTLSGITALPVDAPADAPGAMRLEYDMHLFTAGKVNVVATLAPTQKFQPGTGLRYAVSFDDEAPRIVNVHADESRLAWGRVVTEGAAVFTTEHTLARAGPHTLKFHALDAGLVLQKIVVDAGGMRPSYLGPPESPRLP